MPTILVVDDCPVDRHLIGGVLRRVPDWVVEFAEDGEQALQRLSAAHHDVVVTDLQMPKLDGLGLVRALKAARPQLPVVLITSQGSQATAIEALREGATYYSPKTALARDLIPAVRRVLGISDHAPTRGPRGAADGFASCELSFELENDDTVIGRLLEHLQLHLPPWAEEDQVRIAMALHEAITNAMFHGNLEVRSELRDRDDCDFFSAIQARRGQAPFRDRRVVVEARYDRDCIEYRVSDQGPGFNPHDIPDPRAAENLEKLSGRGLLLIRSFMDEVRHNAVGNQITMRRVRRG